MRTVVVVQARTGSTRLPGKVLLDVGGSTLLERMLERLAWAKTADAVIVATTTDSSDDGIVALAAEAGFACHRGHPSDLLDRHYQVALATGADVVVKIPSDCPLVDPAVVDRVVAAHLVDCDRWHYTSNLHPETYPDGSDVEAMNVDALATAWRDAKAAHEREHTTPFFWQEGQSFRVQNVVWETGRDVSRTHRVVVDYPEDVDVVRAVFEALWRADGAPFSVGDIVSFLDEHPAIRLLNAHRFGVNWQVRQVAERAEKQTPVGGPAKEKS